MKIFEQFLKDNLDKLMERYDDTALDQCVDLATGYCMDVYGLSAGIFAGIPTATEIWTDPTDEVKKDFDFIENKPDNKPDKGDIVVFGKGMNHVVIATGEGDFIRFKCFSQNDPLFSPCIYKEYDYSCVLGWLRYSPKITITVAQNEENVTRASAFKEVCYILKVDYSLDTAKAALKADSDQISSLQKTNEELNRELKDLQKQLNEKPTPPATVQVSKPIDNQKAVAEIKVINLIKDISNFKDDFVAKLKEWFLVEKGGANV